MIGARTVAALLVALLLGWAGTAVAQEEAITSATPDIVRLLREDVVRDRRQADAQVERGRQWRDMQAGALRRAGQAGSEDDRKSWQDSAQQYDRFARDVEAYAQKLRAQADAAEARADRLDAALKQREEAARPAAVPPPAPPAVAPPAAPLAAPAAAPSPPPAPAAPVPSVAGEPGSPEERNPAGYVAGRYQRDPVSDTYPPVDITLDGESKVKFAGLHGDWTGTFTPPTDTAFGKLVFTRKPAPHEMSGKAPLWARQAVAGKLEWRLELEVFECPDLHLVGKWYPGELRWSDRGGKREASVSGPGTPVDYTFNRVLLESEHWAEVEASPVVTIASPGAPLARGGLRSVAKTRPFLPVVRTSIAWARARGDTIRITLRGEQSGKTAEVELVRFGSANVLPVIYMPREPVVIDDHAAAPIILGTPLSVQLSKETVRFDVPNGEVVTAEIEGGSASFIVYNSWVQEGIANHRRNFEQFHGLFQATLADSVSTRETKEIALQKSLMIRNFEKLLEYQPQGDENFTDYTRFELGQQYMRLLKNYGQEDGRGRTATPLRAPPPDKYGVVYTTNFEKEAVGNAVAAGRQRYRDMFQMMGTELLVGTYEFFVNVTGAAQFVAVAWEIDPHGNPIDATDRLFAGIGLASQLLLVGATTAGQISKLSTETKLTDSWGKLLERDMIAAQKRMMAKEARAAAPTGSAGAPSAAPRQASARPGPTSPALAPGKAPNMARNLEEEFLDRVLDKVYEPHPLRGRNAPAWDPLYPGDPTFEVPIDVPPLNSKGTPMQIGTGSCGLAVAEGGMRDIGFVAVPEKENLRVAVKSNNFGPFETTPGKPNFSGGGMTIHELGQHMYDHGAVVRKAMDVRGKPFLGYMTLGLRQGKQYYALVNNGTRANPSWHWVRYEGMTCSEGRAWTHIGDPWRGGSSKMSPRMLSARTYQLLEVDWRKLEAMLDGKVR